MVPCQDPELPPAANPSSPTVQDVALDGIDLARAYVNCKRKHDDLIKWVQGISK